MSAHLQQGTQEFPTPVGLASGLLPFRAITRHTVDPLAPVLEFERKNRMV